MLRLSDYFDLKWLILALVFTLTVILLTHIPQRMMPSQVQESGFDKILHVLAYAAITFFLILSVKSPLSVSLALRILLVLLAVSVIDEVTQPIVGRHASLTDITADVIGIAVVLLLFVLGKHHVRKVKTEPASLLCFTAVVAFTAGALIGPAALFLVGRIGGPNLQQQQKHARHFFYKTMHELFEGTYNPEQGTVSQDAMDTFRKFESELGGKCQLFIYDDWYSRNMQRNGYFNGPAFFPSGDVFHVGLQRTNEHFVLKEFNPVEWDQGWEEEIHKSKEFYNKSLEK
jgi:VanZ family protein